MDGGCGEVRTPDIRLVRATLSQLSYTPKSLALYSFSEFFAVSLVRLLLQVSLRNGGTDGTRTRDPLRDRQVF